MDQLHASIGDSFLKAGLLCQSGRHVSRHETSGVVFPLILDFQGQSEYQFDRHWGNGSSG